MPDVTSIDMMVLSGIVDQLYGGNKNKIHE